MNEIYEREIDGMRKLKVEKYLPGLDMTFFWDQK